MTANRHSPPRWLEAIARRTIREGREFMLGDLQEEFADLVDTRGRGHASRWYMGQVFRVLISRLRRSLATGTNFSIRRGVRTTGVWSDIKGALRTYRRRPGFTAVALGTIALGIGANTAIFSVIDGIAIRPLPFEKPGDLYAIWTDRTFSKEMIREFQEQTTKWETVTGYSGWGFTITGIETPVAINGAQVSANYFSLLGAPIGFGRALLPDDELPGAAPVVVLSHQLWMSVFGGDSSVVGQTIQMGGADSPARTIVGVMPDDFRDIRSQTAAWVPFLMDPADPDFPSSWYVRLFGRVIEDAADTEVQSELTRFAQTAHEKRPEVISDEEAATATLLPLKEYLRGDANQTLILLGGAVGLVLLIACVNIANLLLALSATREKEFAVRSAMGAGNGRVVRQVLTESAVLGVVGGMLGIAVGYGSFAAFKARAARNLSLLNDVEIDLRVIGFSIALTLFASLIFGLLPALKSSRNDIVSSLKSDSRTSSQAGSGRLSAALVSAEVALAVVLTIGAGLMLRSYNLLNQVDPGFNTSTISMELGLPPAIFADRPQQRQFFRDLNARLEATPGVQRAGTVHLLPMTSSNWSFPMHPAGVSVPEDTPAPTANFRVIGPGYFETMQIPVLQGRDISTSDLPDGEQVGWVNRTFAEQFWPGENPIGRQVNIFHAAGPAFTVVGVVGDIKQHSLEMRTQPEIYRPYEQWTVGSLFLVVRASGTPEAIVPTVRETIRSINRDVPISSIQTLDQVLQTSTAEQQLVAELTVLFATLALGMGAIGVYGVTSYVVGRRTREIGVRMALGANRGRVLREVFSGSNKPVLIGLVIGIGLSLVGGRLMESLLFGISATDPSVYIAAAATIVTAAAVASIVPARRASKVDPNIALQSE